MVLMDMIFGIPADEKNKVLHIGYGMTWICSLFLADNLHRGVGSFWNYMFIFLIFEVVFSLLLCKGNIICRFVTMLVGWTTFVMSKALVSSLGASGIWVYLSAGILEILLALYIYHFRFSEEKGLKIRVNGNIVSTCVLMFVITVSHMVILLQDLRKNMHIVGKNWELIVLFLLTEIVIYTLISHLSNEYTEKAYMTMVEEKKVHSAEIKEMHKLNHELKNKVFYINELLESKSYDKLEKYVKENFDVKIDSNEDYTGNRVVDNCIKIKMEKAKSQDIDFQLEAGTLPLGIIDEGDMTSLLFNLLDNAIEAQTGIIDKWIRLKIRFIKGYIYLYVENSTEEDVLKENPELSTSKEESERHGFGREIIKDIVNKYNGMMKYESHDDRFAVNIMLMI